MEPNPYEPPRTSRSLPRASAPWVVAVLIPLCLLASAIAGGGVCTASATVTAEGFDHSSNYLLIFVAAFGIGSIAGAAATLAAYALLAAFFGVDSPLTQWPRRLMFAVLLVPVHGVAANVGYKIGVASLQDERAGYVMGACAYFSAIVTWYFAGRMNRSASTTGSC